MKNKIVLLTLCAVMAVMAFTGCKNENIEASDTGVTSSAAADDNAAQGEANGTFDIETVRKNIVIKGQPFEIPMALKDLPEGWTYKVYDEKDIYSDEGLTLANLYYNDEEMFVGALENYYYDKKNNNKALIYNFIIKTGDCSIDGLIPLKSTKQNVIDKYGEPNGKNEELEDLIVYYYGTINNNSTMFGRTNEQRITIAFNENETVTQISITYADLSKNY